MNLFNKKNNLILFSLFFGILFCKNINAQNNTKSVFETADEIKVYSYKGNFMDFDNIYLSNYDNYPRYYENLPSITNGYFNVHQVHEILTLNESQKLKLYKVLEDSTHCVPKKIIQIVDGVRQELTEDDEETFCGFEPRHAVVFCKNNKVFSCILVCVSCTKIHLGFSTSGKWCHDKIMLLKDFFIEIGIKRGFETRDDRIKLKTIIAD